ncbi:WhiB family transcriptional regulator [Kutzneria albida]|uniref:WhiB family transcriptional regulator n=1 Tax=Kutzneria albida TaxID=43357 RepID=UPI003B82DEA8
MDSPGDDARPDHEHQRRRSWRSSAACGGRLDLEWFDPEPAEKLRCLALCSACPVRTFCELEAFEERDPWGIWGGLDPEGRRQVAEERNEPMPAVLPPHGTNSRYAKHHCRCRPCGSAHVEHEQARRARQSLSA